jgi:hypothetical protein
VGLWANRRKGAKPSHAQPLKTGANTFKEQSKYSVPSFSPYRRRVTYRRPIRRVALGPVRRHATASSRRALNQHNKIDRLGEWERP